MEALESQGRPREDERCDHENAGGVAECPGAKHPPELVSRDHVAQAQRQRPERGTHHRRDQRAGDEGEYVGDPLQPATSTREAAQQQRGNHECDGVPERLGQHRPQWRRVVAEEQIADHDRGPQADAVEEQHGEAEAGRRPQRRHRAVEVGQLETDPPGDVVQERHERDREHIEPRPRAIPVAEGIDPLPHRRAARPGCLPARAHPPMKAPAGAVSKRSTPFRNRAASTLRVESSH